MLFHSFSAALNAVVNPDNVKASVTFTFTFSHLADAFIQSDLQLGSNWGYIASSAIYQVLTVVY